MTDIKNYLDESLIAALKKSGMSEKDIASKVEAKINSVKGMFPDTWEKTIKNSLKAYFSYYLQSGEKFYKAVIIGLGNISDSNAKWRNISKKKAGEVIDAYPKKAGETYTIKENCFSYGFAQGKPIPNTEAYEQSGFIGIEIEGELVFKECEFQGDWVNDSNINKAKSGDKIKLKIDQKGLEGKTLKLFNGYELDVPISDTVYNKLIAGPLTKFKKDLKTIKEGKYSGMIILENMEVINIDLPNQFGKSTVILSDPSVEGDVSGFLTLNLDSVPFVEMAVGITLIGNCYFQNDILKMQVYKVIVPENCKAPEQDKEAATKIAETSLAEPTEEVNLSNNVDVPDTEDLL